MWLLRLWRFVWLQVRRTFTVNLRAVPLSLGEEAVLTRRGVEEDAWRRYLAWRRSVCLFAAAATLVEAIAYTLGTLSFYLLFPRIWSGLGLFTLGVGCAAAFIPPAAALAAALAWARPRRSFRLLLGGWLVALVLPVALSFIPAHHLFNLAPLTEPEEREILQALLQGLEIPLSVTAGARLRQGLEQAIDVAGALVSGLLLLPAVLSLLPGVVQACIRLKFLLPESVVPGWFLLAVTPVQTFFLLALVVALTPWLHNPWLLVGTLLFLVAPLVYLLAARVLTRPAVSAADYRALRQIQLAYSCTVWAALGLFLLALTTWEIHLFGERRWLLGFDEDTSFLQFGEATVFVVEYLGRGLFTMAVVAELLLRVNLSVWRQTRDFARTAAGEGYDEKLGQFGRLLDASAGPDGVNAR